MSIERMRLRIENANRAFEVNKKYFRRVRINDYLYGQAIYTLGDYPKRVYTQVTDYDCELIKQLSDAGVSLIQLHEDWNDASRLHGADKWSSSDPDGLISFIDLCHSHGIKVIPYVSTGFINEFDPCFKEEFSLYKEPLPGLYYKYRKCDVGVPEWRKFVTEKSLSVMDNYGFDGIYNDLGYAKFDRSISEFALPPFIEPEQLLASCRSSRQGTLCRLSFCQSILIGLMLQKLCKGGLVVVKEGRELEQFHFYHLLQGILTDVMG